MHYGVTCVIQSCQYVYMPRKMWTKMYTKSTTSMRSRIEMDRMGEEELPTAH